MFEINIRNLVIYFSIIIIARNQSLDSDLPKKYTFNYAKAMYYGCTFKYEAKKRAPIEHLLEDIQKNRPEHKKILEIQQYLETKGRGMDLKEKKKLEEYLELIKKRLKRKNNVEEVKKYLTGYPKVLDRKNRFCFQHHFKGEYIENQIYHDGYDVQTVGHAANGQMGYISNDRTKRPIFGERDALRQKCRDATKKHTGKSGSCVSYPELYDKPEYAETTDEIFRNMREK